jgi:hypothetical protein
MKKYLLGASGLVVLLVWTRPASAEITFTCGATNKAEECAFSVVHPDGKGMTNFVVAAGQSNAISDAFAGGRYCVVVSRPRAQVKDWPQKCTNSVTGQPGKTGGPLKAGGKYN